jgi:hypothetical protein
MDLIVSIAKADMPKYYFDVLTIMDMLNELENKSKMQAWKVLMMSSHLWLNSETVEEQFYTINALFYTLREILNEKDLKCKKTKSSLQKYCRHLEGLKNILEREATSLHWVGFQGEDSPC